MSAGEAQAVRVVHRRRAGARLPVYRPESSAHTALRLERHDPAALAEALLSTYQATGLKRLAPRLGYANTSMLYKQTELAAPDDRCLGDRPRTVERNPADTIVRAILNARREGADEERAAAVLFEICRQCGYERPERALDQRRETALAASVGHLMAAAGHVAVEIDKALGDGELTVDEARTIADRADEAIEWGRQLKANALACAHNRHQRGAAA